MAAPSLALHPQDEIHWLNPWWYWSWSVAYLWLQLTLQLSRVICHRMRDSQEGCHCCLRIRGINKRGFVLKLLFYSVRRKPEAVFWQKPHLLLKCPTCSYVIFSLFMDTFHWSSGSDPFSYHPVFSQISFEIESCKAWKNDLLISSYVNPPPFKGLLIYLYVCVTHWSHCMITQLPFLISLTLFLPYCLLQPLIGSWLILDYQISKQRSLPDCCYEALTLFSLLYSKEQNQW